MRKPHLRLVQVQLKLPRKSAQPSSKRPIVEILFNFWYTPVMTERQDSMPTLDETQTGQAESTAKINKLENVINLLRVSPVQQLGAAILGGVMVLPGFEAAERFSDGDYLLAIGFSALTLWNLTVIGLSEATALPKLSQYKEVRKALAKFGWDPRIIEPKSHSWCQRHAARTAAVDSGYESEVNEFLAQKGYRWYHFLPDTLDKPEDQLS